MEDPSVSCLFYLFGDSTESASGRWPKGWLVAIPGSQHPAMWWSLERLLIKAAIWELIHTDVVRSAVVEEPRPTRYSRGRPHPVLYLSRQHRSTPDLHPDSLGAQLLAPIPGTGVSAAGAILDWAGDRWPLPLDAVIATGMREALAYGILRRAKAPPVRNRLLARKVLIPTLECDASARDALRPAFVSAQDAWLYYCDLYPQESDLLDKACHRGLTSLRPSTVDAGGGPG